MKSIKGLFFLLSFLFVTTKAFATRSAIMTSPNIKIGGEVLGWTRQDPEQKKSFNEPDPFQEFEPYFVHEGPDPDSNVPLIIRMSRIPIDSIPKNLELIEAWRSLLRSGAADENPKELRKQDRIFRMNGPRYIARFDLDTGSTHPIPTVEMAMIVENEILIFRYIDVDRTLTPNESKVVNQFMEYVRVRSE